jgi:hypothetical protein
MAARKRYRRSRKTTPLQELGFVAVLMVGVLVVSFRQYVTYYNLGLIVDSLILTALF